MQNCETYSFFLIFILFLHQILIQNLQANWYKISSNVFNECIQCAVIDS